MTVRIGVPRPEQCCAIQSQCLRRYWTALIALSCHCASCCTSPWIPIAPGFPLQQYRLGTRDTGTQFLHRFLDSLSIHRGITSQSNPMVLLPQLSCFLDFSGNSISCLKCQEGLFLPHLFMCIIINVQQASYLLYFLVCNICFYILMGLLNYEYAFYFGFFILLEYS